MKISVIIPTKNEEKNISRLLRSLKKQTFRDFETIIVDNNSSDQTKKIASKFTCKIFTHGPERSAQKNFGLQKAKGKYALFLDADMILEKTILEDCFGKMESDSGLAGIIIEEESKGPNFLAKIKSLEKELYKNELTMEAARFFRKKDLEKIGGYDEKLISGEDWDLSQRMQVFGQLDHITPKIFHHEPGSVIADIKKKYYYARHIQKYAAKHPNQFKKQAGLSRFSILFKDPKIIMAHPIEFMGLLFLKSAQFITYLLARF